MKKETLWLLIGLGALVLFTGGAAVVLATWKTRNNAAAYLPLLADAERQYGIPTDLLARLAYEESRFRTDIADGLTVSPAGAVGLMQMLPKYFGSPTDLATPAIAVPKAAQYLRQLYDRFGSWRLAVAAYNAGPTAVAKYGDVPPFTETQHYVSSIFGDLPASAAYV